VLTSGYLLMSFCKYLGRTANIFQYISKKMQPYTVYFILKLLFMFRVVPPHIISSTNNCIYSICYLSHRYCYLPLSWKSWDRFECAVGGVRVTPLPLFTPRERSGTHCTGGGMGPRAGLDRCGISRPHRDTIPGPSSL
jgi:hypothetical protein